MRGHVHTPGNRGLTVTVDGPEYIYPGGRPFAGWVHDLILERGDIDTVVLGQEAIEFAANAGSTDANALAQRTIESFAPVAKDTGVDIVVVYSPQHSAPPAPLAAPRRTRGCRPAARQGHDAQ